MLNIAIDRQSEDLYAPYFFALRTLMAPIWAGIDLMLFATITSRSGQTEKQVPLTAH